MVGEVRVWVRVAGQEMASSLPTGEVASPAVRGGARVCARAWPPKPGLTVMTSTWSTLSRLGLGLGRVTDRVREG